MIGLELYRALERDQTFKSRTQLEIVMAGNEKKWPPPINKPVAYIINADKHWVGLYIDDDCAIDYFDSYGTAPLRGIYQWTKKWCNKDVRYNRLCLQSPLSVVCGMYTIFFLRLRSRGYCLEDIQKFFDPIDLGYNDALITYAHKMA